MRFHSSSTNVGQALARANRIAYRIIALTLCRKGELVKARKEHVNIDRGEWRIPSANAKNRQEHIVYLSQQARRLFTELLELAGDSDWVLPGRVPSRHLSLTAFNQVMFVLRRKGGQWSWLRDVWIHDLRRTASTHLHEMGFASDVIEKALNHTIGGVRGVYNRAQYADQRRKLLQAWADYLDGLLVGAASVVPLKRGAAA